MSTRDARSFRSLILHLTQTLQSFHGLWQIVVFKIQTAQEPSDFSSPIALNPFLFLNGQVIDGYYPW